MSNARRISVVIPLFNNAPYIRRALESVLAQTVADFEVTVVDDGSTDGGGNVACEVNDPRIRVVEQENRGVSAARNRGIELSTAPLVAFLDADDEWLPGFLETMLSLEERFPQAAIFGTGYHINKGSGRVVIPEFTNVPSDEAGGIVSDYFAAALGLPPICSSCVAVRRTVLEEIGGFPEHIRMGEDTVTWMNIALRYPVAWSPITGAIYHQSGEHRACRTFFYGEPPMRRCLEEYLAEHDIPDLLLQSVREYLAKYDLVAVQSNWLAGKTDIARSLLAKSSGTRRFRRQWLFWRLVTTLPRPLFLAAWKLSVLALGRGPVSRLAKSIYREEKELGVGS